MRKIVQSIGGSHAKAKTKKDWFWLTRANVKSKTKSGGVFLPLVCVSVYIYPDCFLSITSQGPQFIIDSDICAGVCVFGIVSMAHRCRSSQANQQSFGISLEIQWNFKTERAFPKRCRATLRLLLHVHPVNYTIKPVPFRT